MKLKNKNILVTGGAGFIGSHLVEKLVNVGSTVTAIDNLSSGKISNLSDVINEISFYKMDIRSYEDIKEIVKKQDVIFHIAANASVPYSVEHPDYDFETNTIGTFNILRAAAEANLEKVVYASSAAVYGEPKYVPINEEHPLNPISPYGASKLAGEKIGFAFKETYGVNFVAIRIFNTYGPKQPRYVMYDFFKKLKNKPEILSVLGSGNQIRDYCYIDDMIDAFRIVAEKGDSIYNAAGGQSTFIRDLAEYMVSKISPKTKIEYGEESWKGDIEILRADISRLERLGFKTKYSLEEGLNKFITWAKVEGL